MDQKMNEKKGSQKDRLETFGEKLELVETELAALRKELAELRKASSPPLSIEPEKPVQVTTSSFGTATVDPPVPPESPEDAMQSSQRNEIKTSNTEPITDAVRKGLKRHTSRSNLEKFVGENIIGKIGIAILVIGVGIGVKYAIDHELISPLTRIILGYLAGGILLGFAIYLKKKYHNFSALLFSGSMAIGYFISYAAITYYNLIPAGIAFLLMCLFTIVTVGAALSYNRQIIAHFGLVGAYAIPFLLSNDPAQAWILLGYVAIINIGILVISFIKYWKPIYYSSFIVTWCIFLAWHLPSSQPHDQFWLALSFITVYFFTFYLIFLAYKLIKNEIFEVEDIILLLGNASVFYGFGCSLLSRSGYSAETIGLFTLANAILHALVAFLVFKRKTADRNLLHYTTGLAIAFVAIAIPVGLDAHWVTLLWSAEFAILFVTGRMMKAPVCELLSYPLMYVAFFSLMNDWSSGYPLLGHEPGLPMVTPLFNINFLTSVFFILSLAIAAALNFRKKRPSQLNFGNAVGLTLEISVAGLLLLVIFCAFLIEILSFWHSLYEQTGVETVSDPASPIFLMNEDLMKYSTLTAIAYSLAFCTILSIINIRVLKSSILGYINLIINIIILMIFLTLGLYFIGELRESYISQENAAYFYRGIFHIGIRYLLFGLVAFLLISIKKYMKGELAETDLTMEFDFIFFFTILVLLSNELINWMDLAGSSHSFKLGLSILWGVFSLLMIALGIWKKKKYLRIGAIVLFAVTLGKLLIYDITYLDSISKTIVFIVLGALLLVISFLYSKYHKMIF